MYCVYCGEKLADDAKFCPACGEPTPQQVDAVSQPDVVAKPRRRKAKAKSDSGEVHILLRILFILCAAIIAVHTLGSLAVGICGESTRATDIHLSFSKKEPNGGRNDFLWTLDYHYTVGGKDYSSFTTWHGTRWSADGGYGKYHVNYLPFLPQVSRFQKYDSILNASDAEDLLLGGGLTLFTTAIGGVAAWFLLSLAIPQVPFIKFGKGKRKKEDKED